MRKFLLFSLAVWAWIGWTAPSRRPIVVIRPMEACPASDRGYAESLAKHIVTWLKDGGVSADMADDRALEATLAGRRLAYLVMPLTPNAAELGALKRFLLRGGRLCVFYSKSPELGALMGVNPGSYRKGTPGSYEKIVFTCGPAGAPAKIVQSSGGVFTAQPLSSRTKVYATWQDAAGRSTGVSAVLASAAGWWVTQVFGAEGDERAKKQFLLSVAGAAVPGVWHASAWVAHERGRVATITAYAKRQVRRPGEIHAVWDHTGTGLYPGDWARTMRELAAMGVTDLFVNVAGAGFAHCATPCLPGSSVLRGQGDQLAQCLAGARGTGVRVHAWVLCFNGSRAAAGEMAKFTRWGWRLRNRAGVLTEYLDPAKPAVRERMLAAVGDIARRYPVHGVHLDFVRWYEGTAKPPEAARIITSFVGAARTRVKAVRPQAWLTTAVLASYPSCVTSVAQDWERWMDMGIVDYIVPMNYSEDNARYSAFLARQCRTPAHARKVISGLGVTANESRLGAVKVIDQIALARRAGCAGVALFDLDYTLMTQILPYLRMGMF